MLQNDILGELVQTTMMYESILQYYSNNIIVYRLWNTNSPQH